MYNYVHTVLHCMYNIIWSYILPHADEDITEQIRDELSDVWAKWYEIGVGLKLSTATLDTLEEGGPEDKMLVCKVYGGGGFYYL